MKLTHLAAVLAAASMMAPAAHASKSRLGALETGGVGGTEGSVFIKDTRNVFLNPAFVSQFGKNINMEFGNNGTGTTEPRAEGGFMVAGDGLSYGVQLGRTGFAMTTIGTAEAALSGTGGIWNGSQATFLAQDSIEIMVGGDGGWGASIHYASSSDNNPTEVSANEIDQTADVITVKAGYLTDKMNVFVHIDAVHEIESQEQDAGANDEKIEGQMSWRLGGSFMLDDMSSIGGLISMDGHDITSEGTTDTEIERASTSARIEYFRNMIKEEKMMAYYKAGVNYSQTELEVSGGDTSSTDVLAIPVTIGVETKMEEWLMFRGSVSQNIIISTTETDDGASPATARDLSNIDSTTVAAGVGMMWGGLTIDSQLGATVASNGTGADTAGRVDGNNLLARVGVNYSF